uniref:von Willebrand factor A domain containing 5B2 n=1 Tax=Sinocyclocheilus grahami TaxID=75366 RepID=A0A672RQG3_SINGR
MPGLKNRTTWAPLLLKTSNITSCANGCSLGITAHLTYVNTDPEPVEGVFVYPLGEKEVVVGFEAVVSGRLVSVELQSRGKPEDCCLDCCPGSALHTQCGHLLLDEDLERSTFIVSTGQIGPLEIVSVVISTTLELPTLENGAIRLVYPTVLTPIVRARIQPGKSENGGKSEENSPTTCFGSVSGKQERMLGVGQQCTHALLTSTATNLSPYQLSFQLLVRGACLLAGLESPTHALRADADPSAQSASATYITLAEEHSCDRHLEIILHLCEPHSPLVILERGRLTFSEYEQQIRTRRDFIRCAQKEVESEKMLEFVRRRYHKDLLLNPVLMLNFCPDLLSEPTELQQASRELIFLIDNSNIMTQHNINKIKVLVISYMSSCSSATKCWHMLFFVFSTFFFLKLLAFTIKCFGLGLGPQACRRLLQGVAKVTGGSTVFLSEEERLQPKLIKCLKKALEPVLTDVRIDWYVPDNVEALLSPNEIPPLYPGNCLIGYCTLYNMSGIGAQKSEVRDYTSDVRLRIQQDSYVQDQYVLTRCSLSSEKAFSSDSPQAESTVLGMGSLPHGLEIMEPTQGRDGLLFAASPLDWDNFTDPECLFSAAPPGEFQASGDQCRSVIHGMLGGRAVSWEVRVDLSILWDTENSATLQTSTESWDEIIHQLTARSVIRDFENMAEKETDIEVERGPSKRYRMKAIQTSKSCGIVCMYTSFTTTDTNARNQPQSTRIRHTGTHIYCSTDNPHSLTKSETKHAKLHGGNEILLCVCVLGVVKSVLPTSVFVSPQVRLQLASGAFLLSESYSECIQIPLDRLKRASPYLSHRSSLSPPFRCTSPPATSARHMQDSWSNTVEEGSQKLVGAIPQTDSGRGSETDTCEGPPLDPAEPHGEELAQMNVGSSSWATAVALAWLEHRCAGFFVEWELVAAKADFWLKCQSLPEGVTLAGLRAAARQLFLLLRHWDENIKLNVLCYNPNNM